MGFVPQSHKAMGSIVDGADRTRALRLLERLDDLMKKGYDGLRVARGRALSDVVSFPTTTGPI